MSVLSRTELITLFKTTKLRIEDKDGLVKRYSDQPYSKDNIFQQCSVDLRVGSIYVPESKENDPGGALNPKTDEHVLQAGHTVMLRTKEKISLPNDVGGICFSPSRVALKAILITNMGHVDPGYSGHLHFTAINMGKEAYTFRANDTVCSMILFKLAEEATPFGSEHFESATTASGQVTIPVVISRYFPKLARDFVDVEKRAQEIAKQEVDRTKYWQVGLPIVSAILIASIPLFQLWVSKPWEDQISDLKYRLQIAETKLSLEKRLIKLERK